jgi:hypothetical protein
MGGLIQMSLRNIEIIHEGTISFATGFPGMGYSVYSELVSVAD